MHAFERIVASLEAMRCNWHAQPPQTSIFFITNDHRLQGKVIPGIQFIGGLDVNVL